MNQYAGANHLFAERSGQSQFFASMDGTKGTKSTAQAQDQKGMKYNSYPESHPRPYRDRDTLTLFPSQIITWILTVDIPCVKLNKSIMAAMSINMLHTNNTLPDIITPRLITLNLNLNSTMYTATTICPIIIGTRILTIIVIVITVNKE